MVERHLDEVFQGRLVGYIDRLCYAVNLLLPTVRCKTYTSGFDFLYSNCTISSKHKYQRELCRFTYRHLYQPPCLPHSCPSHSFRSLCELQNDSTRDSSCHRCQWRNRERYHIIGLQKLELSPLHGIYTMCNLVANPFPGIVHSKPPLVEHQHKSFSLDLCNLENIREIATTINRKVFDGKIPPIHALIPNPPPPPIHKFQPTISNPKTRMYPSSAKLKRSILQPSNL